jgi:hypothetical protein
MNMVFWVDGKEVTPKLGSRLLHWHDSKHLQVLLFPQPYAAQAKLILTSDIMS